MTILALPPEDRALSPHTGWTRAHLMTVADAILDGAARHASPAGAGIRYPGAPGGFGAAVDALEGFSRTFLLAAFRIAGDPRGTEPLAERYARGLAAGVDPAGAERWPRPDEVDQAKVEAAALALGLHLTRDTVWARLDDSARTRTVDYLAAVVGGSHPPNNWAWFRVLVEQFLESVRGPSSDADRAADFALLDGFERDGGWSADGAARSFDHYAGWALSFYPLLWADMVGEEPRHADRTARYRRRLDAFLDDALHLVGADGGPLIQGRSLTYRFATAAAAGVAAFSGTSRHDPGLLRRAVSGQVRHFTDRGAPDATGVLPLGWHGAWRPLAQDYSGPGSPYWAAKGLLPLALPAAHPFWTAVEQPLPIDRGPFTRVLIAPGWLATGTADGIVRVVNHGTDHRMPGAHQPDAPLYAKLGYSTATAPVLAGPGVRDPLDGTVAVVRGGRASHRSGFATGALRKVDDAVLGGSSGPVHWHDGFRAEFDVGGGGAAAETTVGPMVDVMSALRGPWEVRLVRVRAGAGTDGVIRDGDVLRIGGWALSSPTVVETGPAAVTAALALGGETQSRVIGLLGVDGATAGARRERDATPLGPETATPWLSAAVRPDVWMAVGVLLGSSPGVPQLDLQAGDAAVSWPDGATTRFRPEEFLPRG
ncbi:MULTISPECIES: DUF2264 domain-containing protein [unclassified Microbacterium]|uniref:DUF2264 domain-containing protein n=1 Tax=unclassified Microbacterium TaxID=2609290 RepID=UPI0021A3089B|nr:MULTISPECIES: DUF2264 domain-containing protein [unclassified Microbacterium]MCT1364597.1 DUF2264 domain-containing protein [Microbacterium sp. p3-SID131]MCT1376918.1 DUF2264 domain-containing protein [Microbacterium sp. p3-SID337]